MAATGVSATTEAVLEGISLAGKRILVTGASSGLGLETARALLRHGADVIGTMRESSTAGPALNQLRDAASEGAATFTCVTLDLA